MCDLVTSSGEVADCNQQNAAHCFPLLPKEPAGQVESIPLSELGYVAREREVWGPLLEPMPP